MKESRPLVSIITPCYNSGKYVERYLNSILRQTYRHIQLILINDGSSDNTGEVILSYQEKMRDKGVALVYRYQENTGIGGAVNTGLKYVTGDYFTWCDSDNFYTDNYVEENISYFKSHADCNVLRCDAYAVRESNLNRPVYRFSQGNRDKYNPHLFDNAVFEKNFHFGCAMIRTKAFDAVNPAREIYPSRQGQNWQLLLPVFYRYEAAYIDKPLFVFVIRENSVSNITAGQVLKSKFRQLDEYEKILKTVIGSMRDMEETEKKRYISRIEEKYLHRKLAAAFEAGDRMEFDRLFSRLKRGRLLNQSDRLLNNRFRFRILDALARAFCFCRKAVRKLIFFAWVLNRRLHGDLCVDDSSPCGQPNQQ